jgi:L-threonylcarbamoyladenylate synthase
MPLLQGADAGCVQEAAFHLVGGRLLAFPTETVYGLGARADDDAAVRAIFAVKGRPAEHPLIVHLADHDAVDEFSGDVNAAARRLMAAFWPGPMTLILPRRAGRADAAAGGQASIGLRVPSHPVARVLLRECSRAGVAGIAGPSANRFGRVSPTTAAHVQHEFGPELWVLDGGSCEVGIESVIIDCSRDAPTLLRPGGLDRRRFDEVLGRPLVEPDALSPRAPGTLAAHYAPAARVRLMHADALRAALAATPQQSSDHALAVYSRVVPPASAGVVHRAMPGSASAVAHELFAVLREFDAGGATQIWVEQPPPGREWDGVRDRLQRAAAA